MEYLFTYGTLQDDEVQFNLFKRELEGDEETLKGFLLLKNKVYGRYPTISRTNSTMDIVKGTVYKVTPLELKNVDVYEGEGYERRKVVLTSGKTAWAYMERLD
ncbi:gamma-glutamylcyclotransferase family protein [Ulvibacterium sp.]|uniref:gamma-glutamylcyclotransferase family protein n=1 Tax=Ulvibacterium sp. TaxID=2665914 RepID=UPI0026261FEC|nr:gamma-glutamylcyclotransferase family protein [Ulvibacterium sp.]